MEVGDRAGDLYAFHLSDGSVPAGWSSVAAVGHHRVRPGVWHHRERRCHHVGGGRHERHHACRATRRSTPPRRWWRRPPASDLYFDAGNAADPTEGGYYAYGPDGTLLWNDVRHQPVDRSPSRYRRAGLADGGFRRRYPLRRGRIAGPADRRVARRQTARRSAGGPSSRPTACSPPRPWAISTAPARTRLSSVVRPRPASPTGATTRTGATCGSSTTMVA